MSRGYRALACLIATAVGCGSQEAAVTPVPAYAAELALASVVEATVRLPRAPGPFGPSLVAIAGPARPVGDGDVSDGEMLADADSCASCHPDAAAQWATSAHSFASFGNPIYRVNVELLRHDLGPTASLHCGGCHDLPLLADGLMTNGAPIPPADLRSHSGVTCRLCHGVQSTTTDGNGSYAWSRAPLDAPAMDDPASIAAHRAQVTTKVDTELCVGCHRGFLSADMGLPVHLSGLDEPGAWRNSAWTGNGMMRVDAVEQQTCIDCHMEREPASVGELGAKQGKVASHRFLGGHTWMASMRGDRDHLARTQAKLVGAASIDVAAARTGDAWHLPADAAPVVAGTAMTLDVVIRNLLVGHRFPGGVLDIQDTWVEIEVADARGKRLAGSGLAHERDALDESAHVLRTLVVDDTGHVLEAHEMAQFRTQIATQTLAAREAQAVRYAFSVPAALAPTQLPLTVTARLRHRSRTLQMQATVCDASRTAEGMAFAEGARGARDVTLDPCAPQPITLIAESRVQLGAGAVATTARPAWERIYEHGMALTLTVTERLEESRAVLEAALAQAPTPRAQAMVEVQLGWVASKQGRVEAALAHVATARALLAGKSPPVLDAIVTDALARVWRWEEAAAPALACTQRAPQNSVAWMMLARVRGSLGDNAGALAAASAGLAFAPRDQDLLRSQATALAGLNHPAAPAALAAFDRFRSPDQSAELRIACAADSARCARDREPVHTLPLVPAR